ncbi:MAG TPA: glycosyl hydrolase family 28-related protein [Jatrophihabitantaceae bacterium]|jgi:hypothetical protein
MPELNEPIGYSRRAVLGGIGAGSAALFGLTMANQASAAPAPPPPPGLDHGVDVRQQGARGDGQADDTAAFVRAFAEAQSSGGFLVVVPPGTYRIAQPLAAIAPIRMVGLGGEASSVIKFDQGLANGLTITQATSEEPFPGPAIEIQGLWFEYAGDGAALLITEDGVRAPFQDTRITGCRFHTHGNNATGLSSTNQRSIVVAHNQFLGSKNGTGLAVNDSDNTTIVQNVFYNLQYGIHGIRGVNREFNAGCVVIANSMSGFQKVLFFENWETVQAVGNMLDGASQQCVHLIDCYNSMLSDNYLGPTGTEPALLIETSQPRGGLGQILFSNNYINHYAGTAGSAAIAVLGVSPQQPVDQVSITGNIVNRYPAVGIQLRNAQNVLVNGNTLTRAAATPTGVIAVHDETPGANHIVHNIVDSDIVADGDTVTDNFQRVPVPA